MVQAEKVLLSEVCRIARRAGAVAMQFYKQAQPLCVDQKSDASPVTQADLLADELIRRELLVLTPCVPVLTEESLIPPFAERKLWQQYWLVDPLDGTRGFVQGGEEFTVNIALVTLGEPVLGVVFAPALDRCYAAVEGVGAFLVKEDQWKPIVTKKMEGPNGGILVLNSSRQTGREYQQLLARLEKQGFDVKEKRVSSSLKLCFLAEGIGDINPCFVPTYEWDTAAAQVLVEQAGGVFLCADTMQKLRCNQKDSLLNPSFFVLADPSVDWLPVLG